MLESLKSILFVAVTVMIALILQAHAGKLSTEELQAADAPSAEQLQAFN